MRLLVFQHIDCEHPGSLRRSLAADQVEWQAVNLHSGDAIPALEDYYPLWVMGGPMDVWGTIPAYREALVAAFGPGGLDDMRAAADARMSDFLACAEVLYRNFTTVATGRRGSH